MSSSNVRLRVDIGRKGCKVQGGFQMRAMQVKESNDPFMFGTIIDSGIWILYRHRLGIQRTCIRSLDSTSVTGGSCD